MAPLVRLSAYLSLLATLSALAGLRTKSAQGAPASLPNEQRAVIKTECPKGTLADNGVCIPVPALTTSDGEALEPEANWHRNRQGEVIGYDQIPRRPERPKDYWLYRYPVEPLAGQSLLMSGYDLHLPDEMQRRGTKLKAIGHGGIDLAQRRGAEIHLVALENQVSQAEVLFVGHLFGDTVVTRHEVKEAGSSREYIVIFGHLEAPAQTIAAQQFLDEGTLIGFVGDSDSPGIVHLHLEIRQVRAGVDAHRLSVGQFADNAHTVACDPRNLLPLKSNP